MKRRTILKYTALATGAAVGAPLMSVILSGCQAEEIDQWANYEPIFFSPEEFPFVKDIVNLILPKSDTPAAAEVGVHVMMDKMIGTVYKKDDKAKFKMGFTNFIKYLNPTETANFTSQQAAEKLKILQELQASQEETLNDIRQTFLDLRQQTIAYYLSSEEIGTQYLNYLPVPGAYEACITLEETGGKAWAI